MQVSKKNDNDWNVLFHFVSSTVTDENLLSIIFCSFEIILCVIKELYLRCIWKIIWTQVETFPGWLVGWLNEHLNISRAHFDAKTH